MTDTSFSSERLSPGGGTWQELSPPLSVHAATTEANPAACIVADMIDGLSNWTKDKGLATIDDLVGRAAAQVSTFGQLDPGYQAVTHINPDKCIQRGGGVAPGSGGKDSLNWRSLDC